MKKLALSICAIALCLSTSFAFVACGKSNKLSYGKEYSINKVSMMGFSGSRNDLLDYIDAQSNPDETNPYLPAFEIITKIAFELEKDGTGTLRVNDFATISGAESDSSDSVLRAYYELFDEYGLITANGDIELAFDYTKTKNNISIDVVHTGIPEFPIGENGDVSLVEFIEMASEESTNMKVANEDANVMELKEGKLYLTLSLEIYGDSEATKPDLSTDVVFTFGR